MGYDIEKLIRVGGLFSVLVDGTVFTMDASLYKNVASMLLTSAATAGFLFCTLPMDKVAIYELKSLEQLNRNINGFMPFVLAFYIALSLRRWWAVRTNALA